MAVKYINYIYVKTTSSGVECRYNRSEVRFFYLIVLGLSFSYGVYEFEASTVCTDDIK